MLIEAVAEYVHGPRRKIRADLHPGDELHTYSISCSLRFANSVDRIVIGNRHSARSHRCGELNQLIDARASIRVRRMSVQIDGTG